MSNILAIGKELKSTRPRVLSLLSALLLPAQASIARDGTSETVGAAVGGIIGLLRKIVAGIGGSLLAMYVLPLLGISIGGTVGSFVVALNGAVALILIVVLIRKAAI